MAYEGTDYERSLRWLYFIGVASMMGAVFFLRPEPVPPIENAIVFGCYTNAVGPPIVLAKNGMEIRQSGFPRIGFHLERHKTGIALTAEAPIVATPTNGRYVYSIVQPGEGWFLDFFKIIDGRRYGVFDQRELSQFTMLARDGVYLAYKRAGDASCKDDGFH